MSEQGEPFLIAEFGSPGTLTAAARRVRDEGFRALDALTPCAVEGIDGALDLKTSPVRWPMLIAGIGVAAFAYGLELWSAIFAYPIDSGGRPLNSWPIFLPAPFEVGVLAAGLAGIRRLSRPLRPAAPQPSAVRLGPNSAGDRRSLFPPDGGAGGRASGHPLASAAPGRQGAADEGGAGMRAPLLLLLSLASAGCTDQSMTRQPHYGINDPAPAFANGSAAQPPPDNTALEADKAARRGERCSPAGRHGAARARQGAVRDLLRSLPRL